jgi:hypothetical protein
MHRRITMSFEFRKPDHVQVSCCASDPTCRHPYTHDVFATLSPQVWLNLAGSLARTEAADLAAAAAVKGQAGGGCGHHSAGAQVRAQRRLHPQCGAGSPQQVRFCAVMHTQPAGAMLQARVLASCVVCKHHACSTCTRTPGSLIVQYWHACMQVHGAGLHAGGRTAVPGGPAARRQAAAQRRAQDEGVSSNQSSV